MKLLKARRFPGGWWHAGDVESAIDGLRASLEELGLEEDGVEEALASGSSDVGDEDEDELRRHQIGWVVRVTNAKLEARSDPRRLYAFDERTCGAETDEPAWMLLAKEERDALVDAAVLVPLGPGTLEEAYDPSDRG
ncbi:MAG: hypothetical protein HOW73_45400 [Polyangiaceae bacterium]|nr:hypothetical protein [Polyangiaceae bacterium]